MYANAENKSIHKGLTNVIYYIVWIKFGVLCFDYNGNTIYLFYSNLVVLMFTLFLLLFFDV